MEPEMLEELKADIKVEFEGFIAFIEKWKPRIGNLQSLPPEQDADMKAFCESLVDAVPVEIKAFMEGQFDG